MGITPPISSATAASPIDALSACDPTTARARAGRPTATATVRHGHRTHDPDPPWLAGQPAWLASQPHAPPRAPAGSSRPSGIRPRRAERSTPDREHRLEVVAREDLERHHRLGAADAGELDELAGDHVGEHLVARHADDRDEVPLAGDE